VDGPTDRQRARGVVLVTLAAAALGYVFADYAPLIPLISVDLGMDEVQAGLLATASAAIYVLGTLWTTGYPDRFGPKPVIAAGLATGVIGAAVIALAPTYPVAVIGKLIEGLASALTFVAGNRYIAGLYRGRRSHFALGLYGGGYPLGGALALALMPRFAEIAGGWRGAFWIETALIGACLLLWLTTPPVAPIARSGSIRDALRCFNCWMAGIEHFGFAAVAASGAWITLFLLREFQLPLVAAGVLGSLLLIVTTVARWIGGWLVARHTLRTRAAIALGNALIVVGVLVLALPGRPLPVALFGAVILGIGGGLPYSAVFNTAAASLRDAPGAGQGMPVIIGNVAILGITPVMGFLVLNYGFTVAWTFVAVLIGIVLAGVPLMKGEEELP
jgi:predicted MFS family arabinose efflux permease